MKRRQPNTIHGYKIVMTRQEQITFDRDKQYYLDLGYPEWKAENYAWDHYSINRKRKVTA